MSPSVPALRPFGRPEDLDLELASDGLEHVVTDLLTRCSADTPAASWWDETVGRRIAALVQLVAVTEQSTTFTVALRCDRPECDATLEFPIPLEAIQEAAGEAARIPIALPDGNELVVRPALGSDQRSWRRRRYASREEAVAAMLDSLLIEGRVAASDRDAVDAIARTLAERDPLVAFTISYACPTCGVSRDRPIDLERVALERLARLQAGLIEDVHALATRYGWTESEVLAIPPRRRARYRTLIDEAVS